MDVERRLGRGDRVISARMRGPKISLHLSKAVAVAQVTTQCAYSLGHFHLRRSVLLKVNTIYGYLRCNYRLEPKHVID